MADELIELGDPGAAAARPQLAGPYLARRQKAKAPAGLGAYLGSRLTGAVGILSATAGTPASLFTMGTPAAAASMGAALLECPALGALVAQAVYAGSIMQGRNLGAPAWAAPALGKTVNMLRGALAAAYPAEPARLALLAEAQQKIVLEAPAGLRAALET